MSERRMFSKSIVLSDAFLDMPMSARCLYMTLGMVADDDGFVNSPKSIMRQVGASVDDMNILLAKKFIIAFDSGIVVIKHWRIHNYIKSDRYTPTKYADEYAMLELDENKAYRRADTLCIQNGSKVDTQDRLGKDRLSKDSYKSKQPPTLEEIKSYIEENGYNVDAEQFFNYFTEGNWTDSKGNNVRNWKQKLITWAKYDGKKKSADYPEHAVPELPTLDLDKEY